MDANLRPATADDRDWLVARHQELYAREAGFDDTFGPLVGRILDDFFAHHDPSREAGWIAAAPDGAPMGSIFCVTLDETTAKLRLFFLEPEARGRGIGRHLLQTCLTFARQAGYAELTLWTHESHRAACALYARTGFRCVASRPVFSFGQDLVEQTWRITL